MKGRPARLPARNLEPGGFVSVVGLFDHASDFAVCHPRQDRHHLYVWVEVPTTGELYECAVNTRLSPQSLMQAAFFRQESPWPEWGLSRGSLSYSRDLDLREGDFREEQRTPLTDELKGLLSGCARLQVLGFAYATGDGLHDVHQNSGEPSDSSRPDRPGCDGALVLYFDERRGLPAHALWVCLKFAGQRLK